MSELLPALPERSTVLDIARVEQIEQDITARVAEIEDIDALEEWRIQAAALTEYLRSRELQGPMRGAQRRIEARIGQLLGEPKRGANAESHVRDSGVLRTDRVRFRALAKGLDEGLLSPEEWRQPRQALIDLIRQRLAAAAPTEKPESEPVPQREPGKTRASRARLFHNAIGNCRSSAAAARDLARDAAIEDTVFIPQWLESIEQTFSDLRAIRAELRRRNK